MKTTTFPDSDTQVTTQSPVGLIVMNSHEQGEFLPEDLVERLKEQLGQLYILQEYDRASFDWLKVLEEYEPEIIFSSWSTPCLPEDLALEDVSLKYVCHLPGGLRNITPRTLLEQGLIVTNWGNSISRTVAECGLMLILNCLRRATYWQDVMHREDSWGRTLDGQTSLFNRTVGLHGFGRISQELAMLLKPFSPRIMALSPSVPDELLDSYGVQRAADLDELFSENDIIVELASMTERNRGVVKERHLRMIPKGGAFVNIGRAGVVDEKALLKVAQEGDLQIGLDVYHREPPEADSPLKGLMNVTLLPHIAGPTKDRMRDSGELALQNVTAYCQGKELLSQVSVRQFDNMT